MKIVIDEALKRRYKAACADQGVTMSDVAVELIKLWLDGKVALSEPQDKTAGQDR